VATVTFLNQFGTTLTQARDGLGNAGVPPVANGATIRTQLVDGFDTMAREVKATASEIAATSTSDPTAFATKLEAMGTQIQNLSTEFAQSLNQISGPSQKSLSQAAKKDPACKNFHGS
jgi:hypothetical protein